MAESQFRAGSHWEQLLPRKAQSAPQLDAPPQNIFSGHKVSRQPSDYAPVASASLSRLMEGQPVKKVSFFEWWHWKWHNIHRTRLAIETFNGFISAFSAGVYVYDTYIRITHVARIVYFIAAWTILVEYMCKLFASNNKLKFLFWSLSLIDAATIAFGLAFYFDTDGVTNGVSFIRALRMLQVVRFMRVLIGLFFAWLRGAVHPSQVELYKHLFDLIMTVSMVVFIGGCAFYEIEQVEFGEVETSPTFLHEGIYWACVTLTTVGYGDFYPTNIVTQMLFPVMIGIILVIVPSKVSALTAVMDSITPYMRRHHTAYRFGEHVVLMGHTNHKTVKAFVDEFFAPDHGLQEMQLVLLRTDPPGPDMRVMVSGHPASHRLTYLQGSPFVVEDLFRTDLTRAMAVFVMCNKYAQDVEQEDTNTMMIVLALSQYIRQNTDCGTVQWSIRGSGGTGRLMQGFGSESWKQQASKWMASGKAKNEVPHIIVQFHLPESVQKAKQLLESQASHPLELGLLPVGSTLFPMCLGSIKHSMIGASLRTPGLLTLITNLTMSCEVASEMMPDNSGWICEYLNGAGIEMYEVQLPFEVHGMTYTEAVLWLHEAYGVILLGLRLSMRDLNDQERYNVHLAPFNAEQLQLDVQVMMGIIMSQDDCFGGPPQGLKPTEPGIGAHPVPGKRMDLNSAMIMPEHGRAAAGTPDEQWNKLGGSFRLSDNLSYSPGHEAERGVRRPPVAEDAEDLDHAPGMLRSPLAHGPDLHAQGTPYTRAQGAPYPQGSGAHAQGAPFTRPGPSSTLCKQALSPHHAPVGGPHIARSRPFTKATPKPQSQISHFTASHPLSEPPDPPAPPPPPPLPPSAAALPESVGAAAASVGRHASGSGHVGEGGSQLQDKQQQQQQQQQQQWQQQQEVQGNQQQGQRQGQQQEQQQRMGGGLKVMARLSSSDSPSPASSSPGGMVGMLHSLRQQAAAAWGAGNTDTGACGAAASPRKEGGASMWDGEMSKWESGTCGWEYNAVTSSQGNRARSGCAVAEGFEHISVPEPHRADASAADVQLDLSESHQRPSQQQQQQNQPGFGSGLRHISLPSISTPFPPNADSSTHLEQQPGGLTPRSSHNPFSKMQDEQQGSATALPLGGGSGFHSAPPSNVNVGQQWQQQQQQQQQNRPKGSVSPFQIQQPAQGPIQGILHVPARLHCSSSCQPQGESQGLQPRASCSSFHSQFVTDNDAASSADMEHTTKDGAESMNLTSKKGNVRFGPTVTSDSSFPLCGHKSESSISGSGRQSRTKQQDPQQIELLARCNSISEQAALMQRFTKAQTLKLVESVKDVNVSEDCKDIILIIGDSCFPYLNDLIASIRGIRRSPLAAAVDLARKQRAEEAKRQAKDRSSMQQEAIAEEGLQQQGTLRHQSKSAGQMPTESRPSWDSTGLGQRHKDVERELCKAPIIIMDPVGPNSAQMVHMTELENVSLLLGNPSHPKDLGKLGLTTGSRVRALVLPYVADLDEGAVTGYKMSQADAHTLTNCSNLRQYCTLIGANLEILTEALSFVNVSYLLPMCINGPPYERGSLEEEDPLDNLVTLDSLVRMGSQAHGAMPFMHKMSTEQRMLNHKSSMDRGPSSARPPGMPSSPTPCEPSSSKGPKHASEMRMKRRHRHEKVLRPSLKSTVLPKHLPSKLKSLTPRQQLNQKVEEYVGQLLADIPSLAPALATGHIYTASTVDKLFCMILFSPLLIQILTKMLGVWDCEEIDERDVDILPSAISLMTKGSQAANQGQAGSGPGQDQLLQQEVRRLQLRLELLSRNREEEQLYTNESTREPPSQRQISEGGSHEPISAHNPSIHLVSLDSFRSTHPVTKLDNLGQPETWGDLFLAWAPRKLLPIGLYRRDPHTQFPYVYTSPTKATILRSTDMVYVLASSFDLP